MPEQLSGAQTVPGLYFWQPPLPSQRPFVPHVVAPWSAQTPFESTAPAASGVQWPIVEASAQLLHAPSHLPSQHTPSAQKPEAHSLPFVQFAPFIFWPQLPFTHCWPLAQSLVCVQASKQAPFVGSHE